MKKQIAVILSTMLMLTACTQPTPSSSTPIVTSDTTVSTSQPADTATPSSSSLSSSEEEKSPEDMKLDEYLKNNTATANMENIAEMFQLIDVEQYDIILSGEAHAIANNYLFRYELFVYLNKNYGYRYILEESGLATTQVLNRYLETGDESILNKFMETTWGTTAYTKEAKEFYQKLFAYNKELPIDKKIVLIGIDLEHSIFTTYYYLSTLLPSDAPPDILKDQVEFLNAQKDWNFQPEEYYDILERLSQLFQHMEKNKEIYQSYLGDKFEEFYFIAGNADVLFQSKTASTRQPSLDIREQKIYENFKAIYPHVENGKLFGQWGAEHTYQAQINSSLSSPFVAQLLRKGDIQKGKICTIGLLYKDVKAVTDNNTIANAMNGKSVKYNSSELRYKGGKNILPFVTKDFGLAKLMGENSPYSSDMYIFSDHATAVTTDVMQYVAIIKNSPAITFLEPLS